MTRTLILTPNRNEMCGMYQLAKDLAKVKGAIIGTKEDFSIKGYKHMEHFEFDEVISFLYPMHKYAKEMKDALDIKWICYDQGIPPINEMTFPNFWRRQYMRVFKILNERSMSGADEYWGITTTPQKPRWTKKIKDNDVTPSSICLTQGVSIKDEKYAVYIGRKTDYKNFDWLYSTMKELGIPLVCSNHHSDSQIYQLISNAHMLVTASLWEGYGRPVSESQALGIPVVCYDTGAHKSLVKKGSVVNLGDTEGFIREVKRWWKHEQS